MRAGQYAEFGAAIDIVDLADPAAPDDGVVIRVEATGVCRSDWHAWRGHDDDVSLPHVPGHEFAGTVVATGSDVRTVHEGTRVAVPFILGCGTCVDCRTERAQLCATQLQPGFHLPGSFAEYVAIPRADFNLAPLPESVSFAAAASLGCRYTTAWRAVVQQGGLQAETRMAVFGCGGVGLAAIQIALARGATVLAFDPAPAARTRAAMFGATVTESPGRLPPDIDLAIDAIGNRTVAPQAIALLRPGGRLVQVGILEGDGTAEVPLNRIVRHELEIVGSHGMAAAGFPALLDLVASGMLDPEALVTDRVDLAAGIDHLRHMVGRPGQFVLIDRIGE